MAADRNAAHAATLLRRLQAPGERHSELKFAALEEEIADLSEVVRICDEHSIEFERFTAFDDLLFGSGSDELDAAEEAHARHLRSEADLEPGFGLFSPLEGERGGYAHLLGAEAASSTYNVHIAVVRRPRNNPRLERSSELCQPHA